MLNLEEFIRNLVSLITKRNVEQIPLSIRRRKIEDCLNIYSKFLIEYIKQKYSITLAEKIEKAYLFDNFSIPESDKDSHLIFFEAHDAFLIMLNHKENPFKK
jgi:hypothetical protein